MGYYKIELAINAMLYVKLVMDLMLIIVYHVLDLSI